MSNQAKESWPKAPDGTTDWEVVFEGEENGLIPLIAQARSPQILRDCALVTIKMLLSRDNDSDNVARSTSELTELVPDDAKYHQLDFFTNAVTIVLREIKQERIELAREYI